jgi:hypothetical protein
MEQLEAYFLEQPQRFISFGRALCLGAGAVIVVGLYGFVARIGVTAIQHGSSADAGLPSLADVYPTFWTWWIPESFLGAIPYLIAMGAGFWLARLGRRVRAVYG